MYLVVGITEIGVLSDTPFSHMLGHRNAPAAYSTVVSTLSRVARLWVSMVLFPHGGWSKSNSGSREGETIIKNSFFLFKSEIQPQLPCTWGRRQYNGDPVQQK